MSGYEMKTHTMHDTLNGVYWSADLLLDGKKVGVIEQEGRGGAAKVIFQFIADREAWKTHVNDAFEGREEDAVFHLMNIEDAAILAEVTP